MNLNPPETVQIDKILRSVLADKPRITKFNINWDSDVSVIPSYNNHNYMFGEEQNKETIQNNFFSFNNTNNQNYSNPFTNNSSGLKP